ncbi:hypothetical protein ACF0H5_017328 [Mactra antiquata]
MLDQNAKIGSDNTDYERVTGFHNRKSIKRSDVLRILFMCVCTCQVCPAHPCGNDPLRVVRSYASRRGVDTDTLLVNIRRDHPSYYSQLMTDYTSYIECNQMVHTGYIKRSDVTRYDVLPTSHLPQEDEYNKFIDDEAVQSYINNGLLQQKQNELWDNVANSLSANDDKGQYMNKDRRLSIISSYIENNSIIPFWRKLLKNLATRDVYRDINTL